MQRMSWIGLVDGMKWLKKNMIFDLFVFLRRYFIGFGPGFVSFIGFCAWRLQFPLEVL
jgi:hypothetical protein